MKRNILSFIIGCFRRWNKLAYIMFPTNMQSQGKLNVSTVFGTE